MGPLDVVFDENQEGMINSFEVAFSENVVDQLDTSVLAMQLVNPEAAARARRQLAERRELGRELGRELEGEVEEVAKVEVTIEIVVLIPTDQADTISGTGVAAKIESLTNGEDGGSTANAFLVGFDEELEANDFAVTTGAKEGKWTGSFTLEQAPEEMTVEGVNEEIEEANEADERATTIVGETEGFDEFWAEMDELDEQEEEREKMAVAASENHVGYTTTQDGEKSTDSSTLEDATRIGLFEEEFLDDYTNPGFWGVWIPTLFLALVGLYYGGKALSKCCKNGGNNSNVKDYTTDSVRADHAAEMEFYAAKVGSYDYYLPRSNSKDRIAPEDPATSDRMSDRMSNMSNISAITGLPATSVTPTPRSSTSGIQPPGRLSRSQRQSQFNNIQNTMQAERSRVRSPVRSNSSVRASSHRISSRTSGHQSQGGRNSMYPGVNAPTQYIVSGRPVANQEQAQQHAVWGAPQ